ncbi:Uu.00g059740.m01.CDS01 [Anthostomella pinea]|uniref:Uu.00g059740.m01.CDS01 n=1 Tax=Anthostomella pinea TaxID=933095 RepID=A0AAI8VST2_9PEZI|nr:Uu.00g059740.m01.CDS01 [Anthostomella pinea]
MHQGGTPVRISSFNTVDDSNLVDIRINRVLRRQARISPDIDLVYKQWVIPKGTAVGISAHTMHMDPGVFPEPCKFLPERWLGSYDPRMSRNFVPFSKGSRACWGKQLAWSEMFIVLGTLFRPNGSKMTAADCDESDVVPTRSCEIGLPKKDYKGLRVTLG